jgi:16S rRNA (cytosine1402-N4)-methyltransferase
VGGHEPVLLAEVLEALAVSPGGLWVDGTVGLGGHAAAVLERSAPDGRLLGTDRDSETLEQARERLLPYGDRARLVHDDFRALPRLMGTESARGVLLDLGVNSVQLDTAERGFSFRSDGPLDMRLDRSHGISATEVVNRTPEHELADIIYRYGEEPSSRRIARAIVDHRRRQRITTTGALAAIVRSAARRDRRPGLDPATRTFQALRIHVNQELSALGAALSAIAERLAVGGRLVVIAFHSLEDREVKQTFAELARAGSFRLVTRKPVKPGEAETSRNPRARSARLRALERAA